MRRLPRHPQALSPGTMLAWGFPLTPGSLCDHEALGGPYLDFHWVESTHQEKLISSLSLAHTPSLETSLTIPLSRLLLCSLLAGYASSEFHSTIN